MTDNIKLPPLPKASKMYDIPGYDEEELKAYAREAVRLNVPAEFDALVADAARYRWLRDRWGRVTETYDGDSGRVVEIYTEPDGEGWDVDASSLDAAIDQARGKEGP
jgi:hypothetical protein